MVSIMPEAGVKLHELPPTAVGGIARLAYARLRAEGVEPQPLFQRSGLTERQIEDRDARLAVSSQIKFIELAAAALQDDYLGFHLGQNFELREIGLLYYVLASSEFLEEALQQGVRFSTVVNEGILLRFRGGKDISVIFEYVGVPRNSERHQIEFWITALVRICSQLTGRRVLPSRVTVTHRRRENCPGFRAFLGRDIVFGAAVDEVAFPRTARHLPVVGADPYLNELLKKYFDDALRNRRSNCSPFGSSVENAIMPLLPHGKAKADEVARRLGVSPRTLARRLSLEGLTFSGVLRGLRSCLAERYLADPQPSISKIAWLLGYQEVGAFTHAFRRWTGKSPREVRVRPESTASLPPRHDPA